MSEQISFYQKNKIDLSQNNVTITVTDAVATNTGQDFVDYMRNRKLTSAWSTTGSTDAAGTSIVFDMTDSVTISKIMILGHNLKNYTIQYWNGSSYADFTSAINVTNSTDTSTYFTFTSVVTSKIKLTITAAQVANADKYIKQFIITDYLGTGQFTGWPEISRATHKTNKKVSTMLSGAANITKSVGAFEFSLKFKTLDDDDDLTLIETLYNHYEGFLVSISSGDDTQFSSRRIGYRAEDVYLMKPVDDYNPDWYKGIYSSGIKAQMKLREVIN